MMPGASVMTVGSIPTVPKRRCDGGDGADGLDGGIVVEQRAAAAIHLHVDEARGKKAAAEVADVDVRHIRRAARRA